MAAIFKIVDFFDLRMGLYSGYADTNGENPMSLSFTVLEEQSGIEFQDDGRGGHLG